MRRPLPAGVVRHADLQKIPSEFREAISEASRQKTWPVYLCGMPGTGKTTTAALFYAYVNQEHVVYRTFSEFCELIMACRRGDGTRTEWRGSQPVTWTEGSLWRAIEVCHVLVIDEIGLRSDLETRVEILQRLLDLRVGKCTVLTGNILPEHFEQMFDVRVASRLAAGIVLEIEGDDRRGEGLERRIRKVRV